MGVMTVRINDPRQIGEKLYQFRKRYGLTQLEAATQAGISEKTYAQFERGALNVRLDTIARVCEAFHITPDEIFTDNTPLASAREEDLLARLQACNPQQKETALRLLETYLDSLV